AVNVGATRWVKGGKVLLIDLDFQGTLTSRCLSDSQLKARSGAEHFFLGRGDAAKDLMSRIVRVLPQRDAMLHQAGEGWILGADEGLADVETAEMIRWLQQPDELDVRFRLRRALHSPEAKGFGFCVIDCPPRLTTACVNALAASDYVIIPVVRD